MDHIVPGVSREAVVSKQGAAAMAAMVVRIAIVGDVHDDWDLRKDSKALRILEPDVVLFTGDFGDENVDLVREVSQLDLPKAVILGNHDCWRTVSPLADYIEDNKDGAGVQEQLDLLGHTHVGFGRLDIPSRRLSIVGGRPFSMGGDRIHTAYDFFSNLLAPRYGVHNFHQSAERIATNAKEAPRENSLIFLAHNGPRGLGSKMDDICGRDWHESGGDWGDPDLEEAIAAVKQAGVRVPLVVFGHMHQKLQCNHIQNRKMLEVGRDRTIYLNAAVVPRVKGIMEEDLTLLTLRHFNLVEFHDNEVEAIHEVWVTVGEDDVECQPKKTLLYSRPRPHPE